MLGTRQDSKVSNGKLHDVACQLKWLLSPTLSCFPFPLLSLMHVLQSSAASQRIQLADGKPGVRYSASKTRGLCSWPSRLGRAEVDIAKCSRSLSSCLLHCTLQTPNPIHLIICLARNRSQLRRRQPPACPPHHLPNPSSLLHAVGCRIPHSLVSPYCTPPLFWGLPLSLSFARGSQTTQLVQSEQRLYHTQGFP